MRNILKRSFFFNLAVLTGVSLVISMIFAHIKYQDIKSDIITTQSIKSDEPIDEEFEKLKIDSNSLKSGKNNLQKGMVKILSASKSFKMGFSEGGINEKPEHITKFTYDFYIGKSEVTQKEYEELMGENPSHFRGNNLPVEWVSWWDAIKFCNAKSRKDTLTPCYNEKTGECDFSADGYRLPTEAEWEYVARGGYKSKGYYYSGDNKLINVAWYYYRFSKKETQPVGLKGANELGLYDMSGNVWEWCNDWYAENYYQRSPIYDPKGPENGDTRVLRGGSWNCNKIICRTTFRNSDKPSVRNDVTGFRLARSHL